MKYETKKYRTDLKPKEIYRRLDADTEKFDFFRLTNPNNKVFEGTVSANEFKIARIIGEQNAFRPFVYGVISKTDEGTEIICEFRPLTFVKYFMLVWVSGVLIFLAFAIREGLEDVYGFIFLVVPIFMLLFCAAMVRYGYRLEAPRTKNELIRLLELY